MHSTACFAPRDFGMYRYPDPLPPFTLGSTDLWWWDEARAEELRAAGAF